MIHKLVIILLLTLLGFMAIAALCAEPIQAQGSSAWYQMRQWLVLVAR